MHAIEKAGGVTALARLLGVSQPRVSNWIARKRVPEGWARVLELKFPIEHGDRSALAEEADPK